MCFLLYAGYGFCYVIRVLADVRGILIPAAERSGVASSKLAKILVFMHKIC